MNEIFKKDRVFAMDLIINMDEWTSKNIFLFGQIYGEHESKDRKTQVWLEDDIPERDENKRYVVIRMCCYVETSRTMVGMVHTLMYYFDSLRINNVEVYR